MLKEDMINRGPAFEVNFPPRELKHLPITVEFAREVMSKVRVLQSAAQEGRGDTIIGGLQELSALVKEALPTTLDLPTAIELAKGMVEDFPQHATRGGPPFMLNERLDWILLEAIDLFERVGMGKPVSVEMYQQRQDLQANSHLSPARDPFPPIGGSPQR